MQTLSAAARTQAARLRLKKSRRLATALLLAAAALFCLSAAYLHRYPQLAYLKAFSEAAMIGGLADWFAVTALFRRPLGLPVPHTAILPRNQNRIADELGRFIEYNFLRERPVALRVYRAAPTEKLLRRLADLMEAHMPELMALAVREAGKTLNNAIAEVREAVDFCRYYADEAEHTLPENSQGVGTIVTISPWNFPLAIFTGEVVAALAAGNTVVAKPAEQTSLIASYAVSLMHEAGIPTSALQLVLGAGDVGAALTGDPRIGL